MKKSLGSLLQTSITSASPSESPDHAIIEAEFNSYILIPKIHSEQDPLAWWGIHKVNFPWAGSEDFNLSPGALDWQISFL